MSLRLHVSLLSLCWVMYQVQRLRAVQAEALRESKKRLEQQNFKHHDEIEKEREQSKEREQRLESALQQVLERLALFSCGSPSHFQSRSLTHSCDLGPLTYCFFAPRRYRRNSKSATRGTCAKRPWPATHARWQWSGV